MGAKRQKGPSFTRRDFFFFFFFIFLFFLSREGEGDSSFTGGCGGKDVDIISLLFVFMGDGLGILEEIFGLGEVWGKQTKK